jgi:hypothetical protein
VLKHTQSTRDSGEALEMLLARFVGWIDMVVPFCMDLCIQFTTILAQMGFYVFLILKVSSIGSFHYLYNVPVTRVHGLISLGVVEGRLCISVSTHTNPKEFCTWVMKEYGVKDSWTQQFVIEKACKTVLCFAPRYC